VLEVKIESQNIQSALLFQTLTLSVYLLGLQELFFIVSDSGAAFIPLIPPFPTTTTFLLSRCECEVQQVVQICLSGSLLQS
jgi:hypothetical protein